MNTNFSVVHKPNDVCTIEPLNYCDSIACRFPECECGFTYEEACDYVSRHYLVLSVSWETRTSADAEYYKPEEDSA